MNDDVPNPPPEATNSVANLSSETRTKTPAAPPAGAAESAPPAAETAGTIPNSVEAVTSEAPATPGRLIAEMFIRPVVPSKKLLPARAVVPVTVTAPRPRVFRPPGSSATYSTEP